MRNTLYQLGPYRVVLTDIFPPVPSRQFDYGCCLEGQEEGGYKAFGAKPFEALWAMWEWLSERILMGER